MFKTLEDTQKKHQLDLKVKKRDGSFCDFQSERIYFAIEAAFTEDIQKRKKTFTAETQSICQCLTQQVQEAISTQKLKTKDAIVGVEEIQDIVEKKLMEEGYLDVAKLYILYREEQRKKRDQRKKTKDLRDKMILFYDAKGQKVFLSPQRIRATIQEACEGYESSCDAQKIYEDAMGSLFEGASLEDLEKALLLSSRALIEKDPHYSFVTAKILLKKIYKKVFEKELSRQDLETLYKEKFIANLQEAVSKERLDKRLLDFDLARISSSLDHRRDEKFQYLGLQTLYDRYLLHDKKKYFETPQYFWMRVAMGLALGEKEDQSEWAIRFYHVLSRFEFICSTPTLFNSGTCHPQLSSCYLSTVNDSIEHIFKVIGDNAMLSKWAGGLGNDWTNIRASGALIGGTHGLTQGVIPFLKIANDTAVAVNQGGKRKGAVCAYLETWHLDIEDFLELRKNTGDERRRTHDMNTANWIPDLFMKRVEEEGMWTLFNPSDVPDLHHLYGKAFEERYLAYEKQAQEGKISLFKQVEAMSLWRKMLGMIFETGHPWITFKDPSNIRSSQSHVGVVHSSNLCTEILLNTSESETAVCNLGSINLLAHLDGRNLNEDKVQETVCLAMRMLDNVIDINFYPTKEAQASNRRHRPVGLGIMGFQDCLFQMKIPYASDAAVLWADRSMEMIAFHAINASCDLAKERGTYATYAGSKWDQGLLPLDTIEFLQKERKKTIEVDRSSYKDWESLRYKISKWGMRNSNTTAIAPTATIANIIGVSHSIEPCYSHLYTKSNLSGEFAHLNRYLVEDLKERGLWNDELFDDLKYTDGSIQEIEYLDQDLKELYATAFEIDPKWLIICASRRQKWIDMGQSLNLYVSQPSGRKLSDMYFMAWKVGLKTTYYCRSLAATRVEKSTQDINQRGLQPRWMKSRSASSKIVVERDSQVDSQGLACGLLDPDCESCQ